MVDYLGGLENWKTRSRGTVDVWNTFLLYGTPFSVHDKIYAPVVGDLRGTFEWFCRSMILSDPHEQSSLSRFLTGESGQQLAAAAIEWLGPGWQTSNDYFWERMAADGHLAGLLEFVWRNRESEIRNSPQKLKPFKTAIMNLAARHVAIALEIQQVIGTSDVRR